MPEIGAMRGFFGYSLSVDASALGVITDGTTYFFGLSGGSIWTTVSAIRKIFVPKSGTIKYINVFWHATTVGSSEEISVYLRLNDKTDYLIATIGDANAAKNFVNSGLGIVVVQGDYLEIKIVCPTWVTNPATIRVGGSVYIE